MNRKKFLKTTCGFAALSILPGYYAIAFGGYKKKQYTFKPYRPGKTVGSVTQVTPDDGYYIHTFYDVCPFSPTERYLAVNKFPFQHRRPELGDLCDICIIDLENETIETVYRTRGWGLQIGAQLQWGTTDRYLYTNDIIGHEAVCVRIDLENGMVKAFSGPKYDIAPDESSVIGFPLDYINDTQPGYGVPEFRDRSMITGAPDNQGLWQTDLQTNEKRLLLSLKDAYEAVNDEFYKGGNCYFFHSKWNSQGDKIMQVFRVTFPDDPQKIGRTPRNPSLITFNADGSDLNVAVKRKQWNFDWGYGGNHPNWHPDGRHIIMNLTPVWLGDRNLRFVKMDYQGNNFEVLTEKFLGSGHMRITPDSRYLVADSYINEPMAYPNGEVPIRLLDLEADEEVEVCSIFVDMYQYTRENSVFRVDPHPEWNRDYKKVCFNGVLGGKRQVLVADLSSVI
jgi:hypothetical protein